MYLRTPRRYTAKGTRRGCGSLINLRWLWLYITVPVLLIPLLIVWNMRGEISPKIAESIGNIHFQINPPTPTATLSPSGYAERLRNALEAGQMNSAIEAYRGLAEVFPNDPDIHATLAQLIILRGAYAGDATQPLLDDASKAGQSAINANPESAEGWITQAMVLDWSGKARAALPYALRAKDLDDKNPMVLAVMAEVYHDLQKEDEALKLVDQAIEAAKAASPVKRAALVHAHYVKALILTNTSNNGDDAIHEYEEAWRVGISDPPDLTIPLGYVASQLSLIYMNRNQTDRAIELVTKAIERDKQDPLLQYRMGYIYFNRGDPNKARTYVGTCHDLDPNQPRCIRLLGILFFRDQNYRQAAEMFQELVTQGSKNPDDYLNAGLSYYSSNQCGSAIRVLQAGFTLATDPKDQAAFENALRQCGASAGVQIETPAPTQAATEAPTAVGPKGKATPTRRG
jgi:tetratricopeptide (TPR) repeat protein